jgi:hypothetical protein
VSEPGQDYGVKWLVEERDRLKARVAVLENELVRRDAAPPTPPEAFFVEVPYEVALRHAHSGKAIADLFVPQLAREVIARSLHRITHT